jgi:hypothetical protein
MDCRDNFHLLAGYASPRLHAQRGTLTLLKQDELRALYSGLQQQKASLLFPGREELDLQENARTCWSRVCQKKPALSLAIKRDLMEVSIAEEEKK